ncbi:hypothetical protein S245_062564, partial [Arachis hypogaea]
EFRIVRAAGLGLGYLRFTSIFTPPKLELAFPPPSNRRKPRVSARKTSHFWDTRRPNRMSHATPRPTVRFPPDGDLLPTLDPRAALDDGDHFHEDQPIEFQSDPMLGFQIDTTGVHHNLLAGLDVREGRAANRAQKAKPSPPVIPVVRNLNRLGSLFIGRVAFREIAFISSPMAGRYAPWIKRIPLEQGLRFEPTRKALPTHSLTKRVWVGRRKLPYRKIRNFRSSFTSFSHELGAFQWLLVVGHSQGTQWSHACLWPPRIRYAFDVRNKTFTPEDLDCPISSGKPVNAILLPDSWSRFDLGLVR